MYVNESEQTLLAKVCYYGAAGAGKADLLQALYDHFAARDGASTHLESKTFVPRDELERSMSADAAAKFIEIAEQAFGASYAELTQSGTLTWLRAPVPGFAGPKTYARVVDIFSATGPATSDALSHYAIRKADAVVFVADLADPDATTAAWQRLRATDFHGPIVLLSNRSADPKELVQFVDYDGPAFAEPNKFSGNHDAFETASTLALRRFSSAN